MAGLGSIYRLISDLTQSRDKNPLVLALYATSVLTLATSLGTIVAAGLAGEVKSMAVYGIVLLFMSGGISRVPVHRAAGGFPQAISSGSSV